MIKIVFCRNDDINSVITSFNELVSNPFKLDDIISLDVNELTPRKLADFSEITKPLFTKQNDELYEKYRLVDIKLVKERKFVDFDVISEPKLTIEYFCEIIKRY